MAEFCLLSVCIYAICSSALIGFLLCLLLQNLWHLVAQDLQLLFRIVVMLSIDWALMLGLDGLCNMKGVLCYRFDPAFFSFRIFLVRGLPFLSDALHGRLSCASGGHAICGSVVIRRNFA